MAKLCHLVRTIYSFYRDTYSLIHWNENIWFLRCQLELFELIWVRLIFWVKVLLQGLHLQWHWLNTTIMAVFIEAIACYYRTLRQGSKVSEGPEKEQELLRKKRLRTRRQRVRINFSVLGFSIGIYLLLNMKESF